MTQGEHPDIERWRTILNRDARDRAETRCARELVDAAHAKATEAAEAAEAAEAKRAAHEYAVLAAEAERTAAEAAEAAEALDAAKLAFPRFDADEPDISEPLPPGSMRLWRKLAIDAGYRLTDAPLDRRPSQ